MDLDWGVGVSCFVGYNGWDRSYQDIARHSLRLRSAQIRIQLLNLTHLSSKAPRHGPNHTLQAPVATPAFLSFEFLIELVPWRQGSKPSYIYTCCRCQMAVMEFRWNLITNSSRCFNPCKSERKSSAGRRLCRLRSNSATQAIRETRGFLSQAFGTTEALEFSMVRQSLILVPGLRGRSDKVHYGQDPCLP